MSLAIHLPDRFPFRDWFRCCLCLGFGLVAVPCLSGRASGNEANDFFESRIRPVLIRHCYECHHGALSEPNGGLVLDHRDALLRGGDSGPSLVAGDPDASLLIQAIRHESLEMPPDSRLPDDVIADFETWVRAGAIDPRDQPPSVDEVAAMAWREKLTERSGWWSLQPPRWTEMPPVDDASWSREPIDRYVLAGLESAGLTPAPTAEPEVLIRRLSFVLTGLPPEPDEVVAFEEDFRLDAELAMVRWTDRLMNSPHFGERFARHWMDVVRYTDTFGYEWDNPVKGSWEYRDYLVRAFNGDTGFDQLIREQLAGDLLSSPRIDPNVGVNESLIGLLFFHMGEHRHGSSLDFNGIHQEMIDNKIDAFSKTFLGMTVACARCHDHKLDAVSQADYYALAGVFMTPRWTPRDIDASPRHAATLDELAKLRDEIGAGLARSWSAAADGERFSPAGLRQWARQHREKLSAAGPDEIGHPLSRLLASSTVWVEPAAVKAEAEAPETLLDVAPDGTLTAVGEVPERDRYTVRLTTGPGVVEFLELEALTDAAGSGPGRTEHGNFVLSHLHVNVAPQSEAAASDPASDPTSDPSQEGEPPQTAFGPVQAIELASATADFSQAGYPVTAVLDPAPQTGWGIGGISPLNVDRKARFHFSTPVELPAGGEWVVTLVQHYGSSHQLGRFRIRLGRHAESADDPDERSLADREAAERFAELSANWRQADSARRAAETARFEWLSDFTSPDFPDDWVTDGRGLERGFVEDGAPLVALDGDSLLETLLPRGYHTHALSSKLAGAIRLPAPESFPRKWISLRLSGGEWAGRLNVPQNAFHDEDVTFFDPAAPATWHGFTTRALKNGVTRVLTEISTASLNPNFPPRTGLARIGGKPLPNNDLGRDKRSWFSLTGIVTHDEPGVPQKAADEFAGLYGTADSAGDDAMVKSSEEAWDRVSAWLTGPIHRLTQRRPEAGDVTLLNWMLQNGLLPSRLDQDPERLRDVADLVARYRQLESELDFARGVFGMDERHVEPVNYRLNLRGDVDREAQAIPRDFLEVFAGQHGVSESTGSGRLALAEHLASGDNAQPARVFVNRVWAWVFGAGLVATPNDFGRLGAPPSHPELLDRLAIEFMRDDWSLRKLVRRMVLSQTFRQSGRIDPAAAERDPSNRLRHHYPTRRLDAEAIRDSLLAVSGRLDRRLHGTPINPYRVAEDPAKRLYSGPLDGDGRRSVYTTLSIMAPPKFLVGFNLPDLKLPTGRRDVTNVPAQALILLNDPFVAESASRWAERLVHDNARSIEQRIDEMFLAALGRRPDEAERTLWSQAVTDWTPPGSDALSDRQAWAEIAHALFNTKEFIYHR